MRGGKTERNKQHLEMFSVLSKRRLIPLGNLWTKNMSILYKMFSFILPYFLTISKAKGSKEEHDSFLPNLSMMGIPPHFPLYGTIVLFLLPCPFTFVLSFCNCFLHD